MFSLTKRLLSLDPPSFILATRSPFLSHAAHGRVPKPLLGAWLANDRLYIHAYIRTIGRALAALSLPKTVPPSSNSSSKSISTVEQRLLKWMIDALVNIHREEEFFVATAREYGIEVNLPVDEGGRVLAGAKSEGLLRIEALFDSLTRDPQHQEINGEGEGEQLRLPWLEFAVVLWGTEKCYLDAWTAAKEEQDRGSGDAARDLDGGALRKGFIPNWTSTGFREFVDTLGDILDDAVREEIQKGESAEGVLRRAEGKWRELLAAEAAFWPVME